MRIEPEEMVEEQRIAAQLGIEDSEVQGAFGDNQHERDGDDRSSQDLDNAGGVVGPDEERQSRPGHSWRTHAVDGYYKIQSREDGRKSRDEDRKSGFNDLGVAEGGAEGRVEGPSSIDPAGEHAMKHHGSGDGVEIPTQQVDAREGEIF